MTNEYSKTSILENIPCYQCIIRINEHSICQEICAISIVIVEIIIFNDDKACIWGKWIWYVYALNQGVITVIFYDVQEFISVNFNFRIIFIDEHTSW